MWHAIMWHALIVIGIKNIYIYVFKSCAIHFCLQVRKESKIAIYVGFCVVSIIDTRGVGIRVNHTLMAPNINPLNTCCYKYLYGAS